VSAGPAIRAGVEPPGSWLRRLLPVGDPWVRLVCFPHAGGSAGYFHPWRAHAGPDLELYGVQYPGRMERINEPCVEDMGRAADTVAAALLPLLDRPLALFGHSLGAAMAYEVSRRLSTRTGTQPVLLLVSGRPAPDRQRRTVRHRDSDDALWSHVAALGGTRTELLAHEELRRTFLPPLRSDYRLSELYRAVPGPRLHCPVVAMIGERDSEVDADEARAWADVTRGPFGLRTFAGDHFYLGPLVAEVMAAVRRDLAAHAPPRPDGYAGP
jgi:pyochelin biosynthesis protein PchC